MQKWEYLEMHLSYSTQGGHTLSINSKEHPATAEEIEDFSRLLNRFGEQGWELVAVNGINYYFKRPKS